jgi:molybdenum cofactor cytidylyltransferase
MANALCNSSFVIFHSSFPDDTLTSAVKFGPVLLNMAEGKILGHNIAGPDGRRALRKGTPLAPDDIAALRAMGRTSVYVAELAPGDVGEDTAARRVAHMAMGSGLRPSGPASGRVNLLAAAPGVVRVDAERLSRVNELEGVTVATVVAHAPVRARQMAATIKIIPFAIPEPPSWRSSPSAAPSSVWTRSNRRWWV